MPAVTKSYKGLTTTGAMPQFGAPGGVPFYQYTLQVKGQGGTLTSWDARIEGSIDGANWTQIAQQNTTDGATVFVVDKPAPLVRVNLAALSLGTATSIDVLAVASNGV
jgi:hypothetical protein